MNERMLHEFTCEATLAALNAELQTLDLDPANIVAVLIETPLRSSGTLEALTQRYRVLWRHPAQ